LHNPSPKEIRMPDEKDRDEEGAPFAPRRNDFGGDHARDPEAGSLGSDYARDRGWSGGGRGDDFVREDEEPSDKPKE
jgi:hypothetical protein